MSNRIDYSALSEHRRRYLLTGGFPELLLKGGRADETSELLRSQGVLRSDAIEKALYKDIPQAFKIQDPTKLERLLYILGGQVTGIFSPNSVAGDIAVSPATVERYVSYLERAFIVFTLSNYSANEETVQRRGKKLYFVDGAVRNAALLRGAAPINDPSEMGLLVENMAASHLRALAYQENVRLYHWRHKSAEVDLIYDHPDEPVAFEITKGRRHHGRGLKALQERFPRFNGRCYLVSAKDSESLPSADEPGRINLDTFFVVVGRQEQSALEKRIGNKKDAGGQRLLF